MPEVNPPAPDEIRKFGVEPDFENWEYDLNSCDFCGHPVLIVRSRETERGARTEMTACESCMQRMSKRTRAKVFKWVFLKDWRPS